MEAPTAQDVQQQIGRIEELVQALEGTADPAAQTHARALMEAVLGLHGAGLERLLARVYDAAGQDVIDALAEDDLVSHLLLLHGLHPLPMATRVERALEKVRPLLGSHGGGVELRGVTPEGAVYLRLEGNCHGCPSSRVTLHTAVEGAIYEAAPDVTAIEVEGTTDPAPPAAPTSTPTVEWLDCPLPTNGAA